MGLTQHNVSLVKNGMEVEKLAFMEGKNLYDILGEILTANVDSQAIHSYSHVNVNGSTHTIDDLKSKSLMEDVEIELLVKSKGGLL